MKKPSDNTEVVKIRIDPDELQNWPHLAALQIETIETDEVHSSN